MEGNELVLGETPFTTPSLIKRTTTSIGAASDLPLVAPDLRMHPA